MPAAPNGTTFSMGFALTDADYDMITGFTFAGFGGPGIAVQPSAVNDSTHNNFINNTFSGLSTAIQITNGSFDVVSGNTISGGSYGVLLSGCGTEAVSNNAITGATYSTYDSGGSAVAIYSNTLATGSYGVFVQSDTGALIHDNSITGFTTDGIFDSSSGPVYGNQVSSSGTGIYSQGSAIIYGNTVHNDTTGLSGYGSFGGSDWSAPNLVYSNQTGIAAFGASSAAFNRVYSNVVGIDLHDTASANHNLVYRNSNLGILVDGAHNLAVLNNTVYIPAGYAGSPDAIRLQGGANNITLENNILWSDSGYDLYATTDSQIGFKSDYNNLYTTGSGKLVWWQKDFGDLFDWQVEAAYDTHSIGYTTISPTLDNPQFVNLATDDYHLTAVTSTSIAAGDPTSAFNLQPNPSGGRIEMGAYGNTSGAALAAANFIRIDYPNFYTDWEVTVGHAIQWHAYNLTGNVRLDLYQQGAGFLSTIATVDVGNNPGGSPNLPVNGVTLGSYGWSPAASGLSGSTANRYWIQVTSVPSPAITTQSRENFSVPAAGSLYYVNDGSLTGDEWSTAVGNNRNTGKTPGDPKANLLPILGAFQLGPGTTVRIDTGNYVEVRNVVISGNLAIGNGQGTTFTGPDDGNPAHVATLDRANTNNGSTNIDVNAGNFVTLQHLTLLGAQHGLWVRNASTNFHGSDLTVANNTSDGIRIESGATATVVTRLISYGNGGDGIYIATPIANLSDSQSYNNAGIGINVSNGTVGSPTIIGDTDPTLADGQGNLVHNNGTGIYATGSYVQVMGNSVYNNSGTGIYLYSGCLASQNVVHDNGVGIQIYSGGTVSNNRVYHNTNQGILAYYNASVLGNTVYSNSIGIQEGDYGQIVNNLVYANANEGIELTGIYYTGVQVTNNTVYQPVGDAVLVQSGSQNVTLRNNILWVLGRLRSQRHPRQPSRLQ